MAGTPADVIRVTADITILVSALTFPDGNPHKLLEFARAREIGLAVSDPILDELADVLRRNFDWPESDVQEALRQLGLFATRVKPTEAIKAVTEDPDDNSILECAVEAGSQYVVSGDRHLLQLGTFRGVPLMKVAKLLELVARGQSRHL